MQDNNKIHSNLCAAIKSLSPQNRYAFAPFLSTEERDQMIKSRMSYSRGTGFSGWVPHDQDLQSFSEYGASDKKRENPTAGPLTLESFITDALEGESYISMASALNSELFPMYRFHRLGQRNVTDELMKDIIHRAANQMSECLNIDNTELSFQFVAQAPQCSRGGATSMYYFHQDYENDSSEVRLTLAIKGKGTAFATSNTYDPTQCDNSKHYSCTRFVNVDSTPELHLAVFTEGMEFGALHASPAYDVYNALESCERYLITITGKAREECAIEHHF